MDEEYDVIVCGTGLKECILSGLLSVNGKKVLHLDRNPYYGGDSASLNLTNLYEKFKPGATPPSSYGANRDWNVDLIPKFIMACGKLIKILVYTKVARYLDWQVVDGTYVYQRMKGGFFGSKVPIHKACKSEEIVPSTAKEVMVSSLMGILEKRRCKNFMQYCAEWEADKTETWKGIDPGRCSALSLFEHYNLEQNTIDFVGHAVALYSNDNYMNEPVKETLEKVSLYMFSISRYGNSPFIYPLYGLGGLPEGFSRLSAIHGGTYMLNKPVDCFLYDEEGKVCGVQSVDGEVARCKTVICDPSYVRDIPKQTKTKLLCKVVRCICILNAPLPNTNNSSSCQIIIPQKQLERHNDIYIMMVSSAHGVALKGKYIAIISTVVETDDPQREIAPALELIGTIEEKFFYVSDMHQSTCNGVKDNVYVSDSFDASSHFESASDDVLRIWKEMMGEDLDLSVNAEPEDLQGD
ncbi:putative rab GDI alpha [Cardiosporidium cionae]|uniref:Rab GDP dissociation inhibitor n=1 Tax=Cardiosporidium cionae TaxID=476202 RepID=A0ABQ7JGC1_9APIC|nr:putative rab GDI alpha [Cardiosporidium cionae]|eukprot:KAF8822979.1 putative rab GDI alpha [Cardiosporidium cionae]